MTINVAILGYGSIAHEHMRAMKRIMDTSSQIDLRFYGVMGRDRKSAEEFAEQFGMSLVTTRLEELLADPHVDVVVVASPTELHAEQTEMALRAGKHVLCEIPLATSLEATDHLIQVAEEMGKQLMVCHTQRYYSGMIEARRMVAEGSLHIHQIACRYVRLRRENISWTGRKRSWTDNLLWHHACHPIDAILWLLGWTEATVSAEVALPSSPLDIPMDLSIVMRTPRDQIASVVMSYNSHFLIHDYLIMGQEGSFLWEKDRLRSPDRELVFEHRETAQLEAMIRQDTDFFLAVLEGHDPPISARVVRPAMAILQSVQDLFDARIQAVGRDARHPLFP